MKWLRFATLSVFTVAFGDDDLDRDMSVTQGGVRGKFIGVRIRVRVKFRVRVGVGVGVEV